jgi:microcystin-dependent protein
MADSTTTHWGLTKPEPGSSRDTWGSKTNADWDTVDAIMAALNPIGAVTDYAGPAAPDGWLFCDGTVFPVASYPKLFAAIGNTYGGDGSTTFAVPDCRGRVTAGAGYTTDSGGTVGGYGLGYRFGYYLNPILQVHLPSSLAVTIDAGGDHAHGGYTDVQGLHAHNGSTDAQGNHAHTVNAVGSAPGAFLAGSGVVATNLGTLGTSSAGNHAHNITTTTDGSHQHNIQTYNSGAHTHTGRIAGSGVAFDVRNPMIAFNKIIFAGPPGFTTMSSPIPGAPARLSSPMRGGG